MSIKVGTKAPDFTLPVNGGGEVTLSKLQGQNVILYFYPKDNTPGCTQEGCDFRDNFQNLNDKAVVLGISKDSVASHEKFAAAQGFPFKLASDADSNVCEQYGVWQQKSMMGKQYMGIVRTTFLIDKEGIVRYIWPEVKVNGHVDEVKRELEKLG